MFDKYSEYNLQLAGYKMKMLLDALEMYDSENPSYELQALIQEVEKAPKKEYEV